jgi:hypothetical protein
VPTAITTRTRSARFKLGLSHGGTQSIHRAESRRGHVVRPPVKHSDSTPHGRIVSHRTRKVLARIAGMGELCGDGCGGNQSPRSDTLRRLLIISGETEKPWMRTCARTI